MIHLDNGHISVRCENFTLHDLRGDPAGKGNYGAVLWNRIETDSILVDHRIPQSDDHHIRAGFQGRLVRPEIFSIPQISPTAVMVNTGDRLGILYTLPDARTVTSFRFYVATHLTRDSDVTVECRESGPDGLLLVSKKCVDVVDNSWLEIEVPPTQGKKLWVGLTDAIGKIAWWSSQTAPPTGVETTHNGQNRSDISPIAEIHFRQDLCPVIAEWKLDGPTIMATVRPSTPPTQPLPDRWTWKARSRWVQSGYEISSNTAAFEAYYTLLGQFVTAHQMKRRQYLGLTIGSADGITARGLEGTDTLLTGSQIRMHLTSEPNSLVHLISRGGTSFSADKPTPFFQLSVKPTPERLPDMFPVFTCSDRLAGELTTRFYWDRALSYPPAPGPSAWYEWNGLIRNWLNMPGMRDPERTVLADNPITPEGYVHTWGRTIGWPFPDGNQYDTRHFDSNSRFIMGIYRWITWRRDKSFLREQLARVRLAMEYQLGPLQGDKGVIVSNSKDNTGKNGTLGGNYWDILPFGHKDGYCNIMFYASLNAMAELESLAEKWLSESERTTKPPGRSPADYRRLADLAKTKYNETFWDEKAGRYIGCVDIDGQKHDYGFTFLNMEALGYGLANTAQAARIYHWMENEPTYSGQPDTYSAFLFAPRATTFRNPIKTDPADAERAGRPPWWCLSWNGDEWAKQCQDGGAILYTSYYDILARARQIDADNAWKRYKTILTRYRMADRLCGGPPLSRGEIPQQENPGAVGVDLPFPESGLVPASVLYAFMGVMPDADGLRIAPRLPGTVEWLQCESVAYGAAVLTIRVDRKQITIIGNSGDKKIDITRTYETGKSILVPDNEMLLN